MIKAGTQMIASPRLTLRRFGMEDAGDMYANWASDPEVTRYLTWPAHASVEVTKQVLGSWTARYEDGAFFNWAVEWNETGRVIGSIAVVRLNEQTEDAEVGYCLSRAYWGRDIMAEALRAVMNYLFDTVGLARVSARHDVNNPRSGRVMQKAGMRREGLLRQSGRNNQGVCDEVWYAALRRDRGNAPGASPLTVRFAVRDDLEGVNRLRKQVNDLHVAGKPDVFKPGFCDELRDYVHQIFLDPNKRIAVAERGGSIVGFAVLNHINRPENPFMFERDYLDIDEFGVDERFRRQGVAGALVRFIRDFARSEGFGRIELNMWEFNEGALAFYKAAGFETYRRYMEMKIDGEGAPE